MAVCAKVISSWIRKVLSIARICVALGTLRDAGVSLPLVAGISLCSSSRLVNGPGFYFSKMLFFSIFLIGWL